MVYKPNIHKDENCINTMALLAHFSLSGTDTPIDTSAWLNMGDSFYHMFGHATSSFCFVHWFCMRPIAVEPINLAGGRALLNNFWQNS